MKKPALDRKTIFELIPIIIFSSLVPLIVFNKFSTLSETVSKSSLGLSFSADPFTFYKMALILACAFFALIILSIKIVKRQLKLKFNFIVLAVTIYALLTIVSTIFSQYPQTALLGGPERNEGLLVIISYYIMFIYSINILDSRDKIKTVFYSLMVSAAIITIIGAIQFFGLDPYKSQFIKKVLNMLPTEKFPYEINTVQGVNTSYSTLSSTNYMAMYLSMITASGFALFASVKTNGNRLAASLLIYAMILNLIGSASGGAYYAVSISLILLLFLSIPYIKKNVINVFMMSVVVIGLLLITNIFTGNLVAERLNISNLSRELVIGIPEDTSIYINDIILNENDVYIDTTDKDFRVINTGSSIIVENSNGENIPLTQFDEGENDIPGNFYYFSDESYRNYLIKTDDEFQVFGVKAGAREMLFSMTEDGIMVPGMAGELQKIIPVDRNKFIYENVRTFHGRGYIWSAALPLLKETIFIGNGPDTFFLHFPQHDIIGKINMTGRFNVVIGKPHNYFIQVAHDSGIIAMILLILAFAYYLVDSLILLFKDKGLSGTRVMRTALFCGIIGYLISGLVFDSNVNTAPVFWTLFAIGVTLNLSFRNQLKSIPNQSSQG